MTTVRNSLLAMLPRVADGGDLTVQELDAAIPDPRSLDQEEKKGWEQLSRWADDADIRAKSVSYAEFKREWIRDCIAALKA